MQWDFITNIILVVSFAVLAVFAFFGLYQLIKCKSFKKVDKELLWFILPLALVAIVYIVFDKFLILNTRPNGSGEPSFPSTHVMIVATIFFLTAIILPKYIKARFARIVIDLMMLALLIMVCVGRVLANMHWTSDVIGGLAFATIFATIYYLIIRRYQNG